MFKQLALLSLLSAVEAETVLGVYIFHRHGDRTSKSWPPTTLTDLGYSQVYGSGDFYRNRYINSSDSNTAIYGISSNVVKNAQLNVLAPVDNVLQNSATGFLQGLYPPAGAAGNQTLADGTVVEAPMNNYQLIPVNIVTSSGTSSQEDSTWLQGSSGCLNAIVSSNEYFSSDDYADMNSKTSDFYQSLLPVINTTFTSATDSFKNAYTIFDYVHVSVIHNQTIPSDDLLTDDNLYQLQTLADHHEFNLAYNSSDQIRAIAGATLAGQIVQQLNTTIAGKSKQPVGIQFGAYASFLSFFGLAQLPSVSVNFTGVCDYASSMTFELVTNATVSNTSYPDADEIVVRFYFANGTTAANPLTQYPLFGQSELDIPWPTFLNEMNKFAISDQASWCSACGNTTGVCASTTTSSSSTSSSSASSSSSGTEGGISNAVAGVIGAMVTLAVILGIEGLILLLGGLRLAKKSTLAQANSASAGASTAGAKA